MLTKLTVEQFNNEVASSSPAPGGGSVSALAGAQAAALLAMYCNLTIGKVKYGDAEDMMIKTLNEAESCLLELQKAVEEDTQAFAKVMAAFKLPKGSEGEKEIRTQSIQQAFKEATMVPLNVCKSCLKLLGLVETAAGKGNESAISDLGVANLQAYAGLTGAAYNVLINLGAVKDSEFVGNCSSQLALVRKEGNESYTKTLNYLEEQLKI
ncbi:MAG: cyclodeaminase/cyclohydrolase family protein [Dethiobacter sp.]|jgi:formiminotetrahydrofolate cyclodeaminase|nr:cyclodeaminase/cyclohydrolase family protein [Dethiobacter sp.]